MSVCNLQIVIIILITCLAGCSHVIKDNIQSKDSILIDSIPSGAFVYANGEKIGITPFSIDLMSEISHELYFKKDNFKTKITSINPEKKGGKKKFIEFGIVKDLGYYYELNPKRLVVELEWESLPSTKGIVPFKIMGELISEVDNMKKNSNLTSEEYDIAVSQILRFFE